MRDSDGDIEGDEEEEENLLVGELLHQKAFQGMIETEDDSCGHHFASLYCSLSFLQHHQQQLFLDKSSLLHSNELLLIGMHLTKKDILLQECNSRREENQSKKTLGSQDQEKLVMCLVMTKGLQYKAQVTRGRSHCHRYSNYSNYRWNCCYYWTDPSQNHLSLPSHSLLRHLQENE